MGRPERPLDPQGGPVQRFAWELRRLREKAGSPSYRRLSKLAHFSSTALSEAAGGEQFPSMAVALAYVEACDGDRQEWERQWREVAAEVLGPGCTGEPYVGLAAFQPQDAERFRGREPLVAELVDKVGRTRFLGVFGPSGCGKSSVLRAGLVPAVPLRSVVMTPTAQPMRELAGKTAELLVVDQFEETFTLCQDVEERERFVRALLEYDGRVVIGCRVDFLGQCAAIPELVTALQDAQVLVGPMTAEQLRRAIEEPAVAAGLKAEPDMVTAAVAEAHGQPGALPLLSHALLETWRRRTGNKLTLSGYRASGGVSGAIAATAEEVFASLGPAGQAAARGVLLRLVHNEGDLRRRAAIAEVLATGDIGETAKVLDSLTAARLVVVNDDCVELAHEALTRAWPRLAGWIDESREHLRLHREFTGAAEAWAAVDKDPGALYRGVRLATARGLAEAADWEVLSTELEREFLAASLAHESAERHASRRQARRLRMLVRSLAVLLVACVLTAVVALVQRQAAVGEQHVAQSRQLALQAQDLSETWPDQAEELAVSAFRTSPTVEARGALLSTAAYKPPRALFKDHRGAVRTVAFSQDGKWLASAGNDRSVLVRDPSDAREPIALAQHTSIVRALAFHPNLPILASGGDDSSLVLWDLDNRVVSRVFPVPHGRINSLAYSEDGRWLVSASQDGTVVVWEAGREIFQVPHGLGEVYDVSVSRGLIAVAGAHGVTLYDHARNTSQVFTDHDGPTLTVALSRDGRMLASGGQDTQVVLRDLTTAAGPRFLRRHSSAVRAVEFGADGGKLMSASEDGTVRWWSVPDGGWLTGLISRTSAFYAAALSPDGLRLAAGGDETLSVWQVALPPFTGHVIPPLAVAIAADGSIATGGSDRTIMVWGQDGVRRSTLTTPATVKSLAFRPDGTLLSAGDNGVVTLWDIRSRSTVRVFAGHTGSVTGLALTGDGTVGASGGADRTIRLFDPSRESAARVLPVVHTAAVETLAFSPDGTILASGGADGQIILWDVRHDRMLALVAELGNAVRDLVFTPDGQTLVSGDAGGAIVLWSVAEKKRIGTLPGQRGAVREIAIGGDGNQLAVAGSDTVITLWDIGSLSLITSLTGHSGPVNALAFQATRLVSAGSDPRLISWELDPAAVIARICGRGRC